MSYEPTVWKDGDLVTSAKLNKLEQGVANGGGILIVHMIDNGNSPSTLDKTWQEIHDADVCYIVHRDNESSMHSFVEDTDSDSRGYMVFSGAGGFIADSTNGTLTSFDNEDSM